MSLSKRVEKILQKNSNHFRAYDESLKDYFHPWNNDESLTIKQDLINSKEIRFSDLEGNSIFHLFYFWFSEWIEGTLSHSIEDIIMEIFPKRSLVRFYSLSVASSKDIYRSLSFPLILSFNETLDLLNKIIITTEPTLSEFKQYLNLHSSFVQFIKSIFQLFPANTSALPIFQFHFRTIANFNATLNTWKINHLGKRSMTMTTVIKFLTYFYNSSEFHAQIEWIGNYHFKIIPKQHLGLSFINDQNLFQECPFVYTPLKRNNFFKFLWDSLKQQSHWKDVCKNDYRLHFLPYFAQYPDTWECWNHYYSRIPEGDWVAFRIEQENFIFSEIWKNNLVYSLKFYFAFTKFIMKYYRTISDVNKQQKRRFETPLKILKPFEEKFLSVVSTSGNLLGLSSSLELYPISFKLDRLAIELNKLYKQNQTEALEIYKLIRFDKNRSLWDEIWLYFFKSSHSLSLDGITKKIAEISLENHYYRYFLSRIAPENIFLLDLLDILASFIQLLGVAGSSIDVTRLALWKCMMSSPDYHFHNQILSLNLVLLGTTCAIDLIAENGLTVTLPVLGNPQRFVDAMTKLPFQFAFRQADHSSNFLSPQPFWKVALFDWFISPKELQDSFLELLLCSKDAWMGWITLTKNTKDRELWEEIYDNKKNLPLKLLWNSVGLSLTDYSGRLLRDASLIRKCSSSGKITYFVRCRLFGNEQDIRFPYDEIHGILTTMEDDPDTMNQKKSSLLSRIRNRFLPDDQFPFSEIILSCIRETMNASNSFFQECILPHYQYLKEWNKMNDNPISDSLLKKVTSSIRYCKTHMKSDAISILYYCLWIFLDRDVNKPEQYSFELVLLNKDDEKRFEYFNMKSMSIESPHLVLNDAISFPKEFVDEKEFGSFAIFLQLYRRQFVRLLINHREFDITLRRITLYDLLDLKLQSNKQELCDLFMEGSRTYVSSSNEGQLLDYIDQYLAFSSLLLIIPECSQDFLMGIIFPLFSSLLSTTDNRPNYKPSQQIDPVLKQIQSFFIAIIQNPAVYSILNFSFRFDINNKTTFQAFVKKYMSLHPLVYHSAVPADHYSKDDKLHKVIWNKQYQNLWELFIHIIGYSLLTPMNCFQSVTLQGNEFQFTFPGLNNVIDVPYDDMINFFRKSRSVEEDWLYRRFFHGRWNFHELILNLLSQNCLDFKNQTILYRDEIMEDSKYWDVWNKLNGYPVSDAFLSDLHDLLQVSQGKQKKYQKPNPWNFLYSLLWIYLDQSNDTPLTFSIQLSTSGEEMQIISNRVTSITLKTIHLLSYLATESLKELQKYSSFISFIPFLACIRKKVLDQLINDSIFHIPFMQMTLDDFLHLPNPSGKLIKNLLSIGSQQYKSSKNKNTQDVYDFIDRYVNYHDLLEIIPKCSGCFWKDILIPLFSSFFTFSPVTSSDTTREPLIEKILNLPKKLQKRILLNPILEYFEAFFLAILLHPAARKEEMSIFTLTKSYLTLFPLREDQDSTIDYSHDPAIFDDIYENRKKLPYQLVLYVMATSLLTRNTLPFPTMFISSIDFRLPNKYYIKFIDNNKDEVVLMEADLFFSIFNPHLIVEPEIVPLYDYIYHHFFKPYDYQWYELIIKNLPENLSSKSPFFVDYLLCDSFSLKVWNHLNDYPINKEAVEIICSILQKHQDSSIMKYREDQNNDNKNKFISLMYYLLWIFLDRKEKKDNGTLLTNFSMQISIAGYTSIDLLSEHIEVKNMDTNIACNFEFPSSKMIENSSDLEKLSFSILNEITKTKECESFNRFLHHYDNILYETLLSSSDTQETHFNRMTCSRLITLYQSNPLLVCYLFRNDTNNGYHSQVFYHEVIVFMYHYLDLNFILSLIPTYSIPYLELVIFPLFSLMFSSSLPTNIFQNTSISTKTKIFNEQSDIHYQIMDKLEDLPKELQIKIVLYPVLTQMELFLNTILKHPLFQGKTLTSKGYSGLLSMIHPYHTLRRIFYKYEPHSQRLERIHLLMNKSYNRQGPEDDDSSSSLASQPHFPLNFYYKQYHPFCEVSTYFDVIPPPLIDHVTNSYNEILSRLPFDATVSMMESLFSFLNNYPYEDFGFTYPIFDVIPELHNLVLNINFNAKNNPAPLITFIFYQQYQWKALLSHPDYRSPYRLMDEKGDRASTAYYINEFIEAICTFHPINSFKKLLFVEDTDEYGGIMSMRVTNRMKEGRFLYPIIQDDVIFPFISNVLGKSTTQIPSFCDDYNIAYAYKYESFLWQFFIDLYFYQAFFHQFYQQHEESSCTTCLSQEDIDNRMINGSPIARGCYDPIKNPLGNLMKYLFEINYQKRYDWNIFFRLYDHPSTIWSLPLFQNHFLSVFPLLPNDMKRLQFLSLVLELWPFFDAIGETNFAFIILNKSYSQVNSHRLLVINQVNQYLLLNRKLSSFYTEADQQELTERINSAIPAEYHDDNNGLDDMADADYVDFDGDHEEEEQQYEEYEEYDAHIFDGMGADHAEEYEQNEQNGENNNDDDEEGISDDRPNDEEEQRNEQTNNNSDCDDFDGQASGNEEDADNNEEYRRYEQIYEIDDEIRALEEALYLPY